MMSTLPRRGLALVTVTLALLALAGPSRALAKSFSMPTVRIEARIAPDGSLAVVEKRSFDFSGDYTRVYWDLETPPAGTITDVTVLDSAGSPLPFTQAEGRPSGYARLTEQDYLTRVEVYGAWSDETVAYTLTYRVTGAATRWADTGELYWQAIAKNWAATTDSVDITIRPPSDTAPDQVKAWAHGPLTGNVTIGAGGVVSLKVASLAANTFVEARILFPGDVLTQVPARTEAKRAAILAEEAGLANTANAQRAAARGQILWAGACGVVIPLLLLGIVIALYARYGKEYRPSFSGEYFREPPSDLHPALVGYLWTMGTVEDTAISASLMNLADRGVLRMEPTVVKKPGLFGAKDENTFLLTLDTSKWATLDPLDQNLLSFLFTTIAGDDTLTISEMQEKAKSRAQEFQDGIKAFKVAVVEEADRQGLIEEGGQIARGFAWIMAVLAIAAAIGSSVMAESAWIAVGMTPVAVVLIVLSVKMTRRSHAAAELYAKYAALRNYLRDFSRLQEAPPASVVLWNQFLVLAVIFGIAEQVIARLKVSVPQVAADPTFATTYWWVSAGQGYAAPISALSTGFTSATTIASSTLSGASGGGGGFSGGGGGGFGGGGGGGAD